MRLGLDTETTVSHDGSTPDLVCMGIAFGESAKLVDRHDAIPLARELLSDLDIESVTHNGSFDMAVLAKRDPSLYPLIFKAYEEGRILDTMIWAQVDDIARGVFFGSRKGRYGLGDLSEGILSKAMSKEDPWRLRFGELIDLPIDQYPPEAIAYALPDPIRTLEIANTMHEPPDMRRQSSHAFWLHLMSAEGMKTDAVRVEKLLTDTVNEAAEIARELRYHGLMRFDKDGPHRVVKAVQARVKSILGEKAPRTPKGGIQTSSEVCELTKDPLLLAYARYGELLDIISKDSEYLSLPVVRCKYGLAETGRSNSWGPNMQNLKKEGGIRECFIPPPGFVYAYADYSGLELWTLAQVCLELVGYSKLAELLREGVDPHAVIAGQILNCHWKEIKPRIDAGDREAYNARQTGKVFNFGAGGGGGAAALAAYGWQNYRVDLSEQRAKELKQLWLHTFPEMREYHALVGHMTDPIHQLRTGRIRDCGGFFSERANGFFQGLGADATKCAGFMLAKACYCPGGVLYGSRPVNYEHDAFLLEVPEEIGHECAMSMSETMIESARPFMPDLPPMKAEPLLTRRHSKDAKPIYVNGRLVPWDNTL